MMKATIREVTVQTENQLNVDVLYEDSENNFSRNYIFTFPGSELGDINEESLKAKIQAIGEEFKGIVNNKDAIIALQGNEYEIK